MKKMALFVVSGALFGTYLLLPNTEPTPVVKTEFNTPETAASATTMRAVHTTEKPVFMKQVMKQQMQQVAQAYENNMRFPKYSKPLSKDDWSLLNPRAFVAKHKPLDVGSGVNAAIVLPQYIVSSDQALTVDVSINSDGDSEMSISEVTAFLANQQQTNSTVLTQHDIEDGNTLFSGEIPASWLSALEHTEQQLFAQIVFENNQSAKLSATFKLVGNDATLTRISNAYVDGAHLIIPAHFDVQVEGRYRVRANLFDEATQRPVSHLNSVVLLKDGNTSGLLKVHATTLRNQGFAGPYILKDFDITRGPAGPGQSTHYGNSAQPQFSVNGFDLSFYSDEEYSNPKNQQRLEFLKTMADTQLTY